MCDLRFAAAGAKFTTAFAQGDSSPSTEARGSCHALSARESLDLLMSGRVMPPG